MSILEIRHLSHAFGDKVLYHDAGFSLNRGEHMGITGANGAGKSTLIRMLTGEILPDEGEIRWQKGIKVGYLDQNAMLKGKLSILDYLRGAFDELYRMEMRLNELYEGMAQGLSERETQETAKLQNALFEKGFYDIEHVVRRVACGLGLDAIGMERTLITLSGGQREKVILARLLLEKPDALVLDEPTNYLDAAHVAWLTDYLHSFEGAFIVVSHDEAFLDAVTGCILDIDAQTLTRYPGSLRAAMQQKERAREGRLRMYQAQQKEIAALEDYINRNRVRTATARQAQSRQKRLDRIERITPPETVRPAHYDFLSGGAAGRLEVENLVIGYEKPLLRPISLRMRPGEKLALTGFNGVGKTTLLRTLLGQIPAMGGRYRFDERMEIGYFAQESSWEDDRESPLQLLRKHFPAQNDRLLRTKLAGFGVKAELCARPVSTLSGGEQAKVRLCLLAQRPVGFLMLDEPTSHLDADAKRALAGAIGRFSGSVILVSHESDFLNDLVDRVICLEKTKV